MIIKPALAAALAASTLIFSFGAHAAPLPTNLEAMKSAVGPGVVNVRYGFGGYRGGWGGGYRGGLGYRGVGYGGLGYRGLGYRGAGYGYRGYGYRGYGYGAGAVIAGAVVGGGILN